MYRDKEVIYSPEQSADAIFYIKNGIVKLTVGDKRRRKHAVVAILAKGAFFGEGCLLRIRAARMSTATSIGSCTIVRVKKTVFWARLKRESQTTLAGMVGTTRTRLNHFMSKFRKQGYVRYNGELEINADRLVAFLQG